MKLTPEEIMKLTPTWEDHKFKKLDIKSKSMFYEFSQSDYTPEGLLYSYIRLFGNDIKNDVTPLEWFRTISKNIKKELYNRQFKEKIKE